MTAVTSNSWLADSISALNLRDFSKVLNDDSSIAEKVEEEGKTLGADINMNVLAIVLGCFILFLLVCAAVAMFFKWLNVKRSGSAPTPEKATIASAGHSPVLTEGKPQPPLMQLDLLDEDRFLDTPPPYSPVTSDSDNDMDQILTSGKLEFAFNYDEDSNDLKLHLLRAIGLPSKKSVNLARYVEVNLLPFRTMKGQTKVKYDTNNPIFNEQFVFEDIPLGDLPNRTLQFCVFEYDAFSKHKLIGEVLYTFEQNAKIHEGAVLVREIKKELLQEKPMEPSGAVLLSMCYLPTASRLTFVVLKAKITNLSEENGMTLPDLYIKTTLKQSGKRIRTTKTSVIKRTLNPVYNEAFVFDLPTNVLNDVGIVVRAIDSHETTERAIGHVTLGPNALTSMGIHHWNCMMTSPRKPIAQWHPLMK